MAVFQKAIVVSDYEAKTHLVQLLERVEAGEEFMITRYGTPVAKLVPMRKKSTIEERAAAIRRIQELGRDLSLGGLKIKDLIADGRE